MGLPKIKRSNSKPTEPVTQPAPREHQSSASSASDKHIPLRAAASNLAQHFRQKLKFLVTFEGGKTVEVYAQDGDEARKLALEEHSGIIMSVDKSS